MEEEVGRHNSTFQLKNGQAAVTCGIDWFEITDWTFQVTIEQNSMIAASELFNNTTNTSNKV